MGKHHLILGELQDVLTGERIEDSHDERYRQKLALLLIREKGYGSSEIRPRVPLEIRAGESRGIVKIDFVIELEGRIAMIVRYGPGSLVTRHRPTLAAARLLAGCQVPFVVVSNGESADVLDGLTGKVLASGLKAIPDRAALGRKIAGFSFDAVAPERLDKESRIVYAFEVDGACPCDDTVCRL